MIRVAEIFPTIQGEGHWTGMPVTLLRLQGCNLRPLCPFCDTKYALSDTGGRLLTVDELLEAVTAVHVSGRAILLTGGEPTMQPLEVLVPQLEGFGPVHLETNGTLSLDRVFYSWITVSPKPPHRLNKVTLERANEIKWLIESEDDVAALCVWLQRYEDSWTFRKKISVQPISQDKKATALAVDACLKYNWRLSIQMHKYIEVP